MVQTVEVTSFRPHLVKAYYMWLCENDSRVDVEFVESHPQVVVRPAPVKSISNKLTVPVVDKNTGDVAVNEYDVIRLNTSLSAVNSFEMHEDGFSFSCRISQALTEVFIPYECVVAMHGHHIGKTNIFPLEWNPDALSLKAVDVKSEPEVKPKAKPHLSIVK